uniref:Uncharacterized protein n=1 Tax=Cacopsylla melanoneura TaxID=428564 RepID=A0A8D8YTN2_9HEMI
MTKKSNRKSRKKRYANNKGGRGRKQLTKPAPPAPPQIHPQQEPRRSLQEGTVVGVTPPACTIPLVSTICDDHGKLDCVEEAFDDVKLDSVQIPHDDDMVRSSDTKENNQTDANSLTTSPVSTTSSCASQHTKLSNMSPVATIPHVLALTTAPARSLFSGAVDLTDDLVQGHDSIAIISVPPSSSVSSSCDISPPRSAGPAVSLDVDDGGDGVSSTTPNLEPLPCSNRRKRKRKRQRQRVIVVNPPPPLGTKQELRRNEENHLTRAETNDDMVYKGSYQGTNLGRDKTQHGNRVQGACERTPASPVAANPIGARVDIVSGNELVKTESMIDVEDDATEDRKADEKSEPKPLDFREENSGGEELLMVAESDKTEAEESQQEVEVKMETTTKTTRPFPSTFEELILMHFHRELNVAELVESMNCLEQDNRANEEHLATLMKQVTLLTSEKTELERAFQ